MTKEEILAKSRNENKNGDERDKKILTDAVKCSFLVMVLAAAVFAVVRSLRGESVWDLPAVCCAAVSADFIYRYAKTKERWCLVPAAVTLIAAVVTAVLFFAGH